MPDNLVPVFVFPTALKFYQNDQSTHKQVLTLINPYDHPVRFQVLCSSQERSKYSVVDPEGRIDAHCCVDIVIRHNAVTSQNVGHTDKFRIQMYQISSNKVWGRKDILGELVAGEPEKDRSLSSEREMFQQMPSSASSISSNAQFPTPRRQGQARPGAPNAVVVVVAVVFSFILMLPLQGESDNYLPEYLKPTVNVKLFVAYVLGLITMVFLRPT